MRLSHELLIKKPQCCHQDDGGKLMVSILSIFAMLSMLLVSIILSYSRRRAAILGT